MISKSLVCLPTNGPAQEEQKMITSAVVSGHSFLVAHLGWTQGRMCGAIIGCDRQVMKV